MSSSSKHHCLMSVHDGICGLCFFFFVCLFVIPIIQKKDRNKILTIFKKDMRNYVTSIAYVYKLYSMCRIMVDYLHTPHNLLQHQRGIVVTLIFIALN